MTSTTGYATRDELYQVKQDLSKRMGDVELNLSLKMGNMQADIAARFEEVKAEARRVEQNTMSMFAALFAHLGIDTPPLQ